MKIDDVRRTAYSMPLTNPSFPPGPYRFFNREYFVITYRTDPEALAAVVPEPLEITDSVVKYEFIRMPDSTGFGDYTETGQVIPVRLNGEDGAYTHAMYLDDDAPIAGGVNSGDSPRSAPHRRSRLKATCWWGRCITVRCSAPRPRWATSTVLSTMMRC
jgi:acetoacetate decarboxylase